MQSTHRSRHAGIILMSAIGLILASITFMTYYPSLSYEFQFDDIVNIKKYFYARTNDFYSLAFTGSRWISFWLNTVAYKIGKHDPYYYRLFNITGHIISGLLVYAFMLLGLSGLQSTNYFFKRRIMLATTTALLFLLHPVQTQTVSYIIQGQLEGLATLFVMAILCVFLLSTKTTSIWLRLPLYVLLLTLAVIATGTKEIAIVGPLLMLMTDWFLVAQGSFKKLTSRFVIHLLHSLFTIIGFCYYLADNITVINAFKGKAVLQNNVGNVITAMPGQVIKASDFFISQFKVTVHYLSMFLWPFNISVDYDWKMNPFFFSSENFGPFMLLFALGLILLYLLYRNTTSLISFGMLWFFICLAPRSTFIPSTELVADYKTYMASIGYLFVLALAVVYLLEWTFTKLISSRKTQAVYTSGFLAICMAGLCVSTYQRNTVWRSGSEFWYNIIQTSPTKARAYNNYAVTLAEKKRYQEAIPYLRKAIKIDSHYPDPWNNISVCYNHIGKLDLAIQTMEEAIKITPSYPEFYNNLSSYFLTKKEYERAIQFAQHAIQLRPYYGKPYFNWGRCLYGLGKKEEALKHIRKACMECDYDTPEGINHYAQLAIELERYDCAAEAFEQLHAMVPQHQDTLFNLGTAYYFSGRFEKAAPVFERLALNYPNEERSWFNLGECYTNMNRIHEALAAYEHAQSIEHQFPQVRERIIACQTALKGNNNRA